MTFKVIESGTNRYTTSYQSAIVTIALFCNVVKLVDVENIVTLKSGLEVRSLKVTNNGAIWKLGYGFLFAFLATVATSLTVLTQHMNVMDRQPSSQLPHDSIGRAYA